MSVATWRLLTIVALGLTACSHTYHPEYHPETRYSFVQNVAFVAEDADRCKLGRLKECWRECFQRSQGEACYLLGLMFETGHGVPSSHADAARFSALAATLGYAPAAIDVDMAAPYLDLWRRDTTPKAPTPPSGLVSSPGGVVVYGSVNGDIYLGK